MQYEGTEQLNRSSKKQRATIREVTSFMNGRPRHLILRPF